jgi:hypothetical protein
MFLMSPEDLVKDVRERLRRGTATGQDIEDLLAMVEDLAGQVEDLKGDLDG